MSNIVHVTNTKLELMGKKGILRPDENGYYEIIIGGFNMVNSSGHYYPVEPVLALFDRNSILKRRLYEGYLKAEMGHPKREPGMTDTQWLQRVAHIEETMVCAHIGDIWLDFDIAKTIPDVPNNAVMCVGKVKPMGPYKQALQEYLDDNVSNTAFSLRSLASVKVVNGIVYKYVKEIITWDYVTAPGIKTANKWDSPSMEQEKAVIYDLSEYRTTKQAIRKALKDTSESGMEDCSMILKDALANMESEDKPIYAKW